VIYRRIVAPEGSDSNRSGEITSASIIGHGRKVRLPDESELHFLKRLEAEFPFLVENQSLTSQEART
jgi:hypothetical protein